VRDEIGHDTPLRLKTAVEIAFPLGGMTVSGLRSEARKGNLVIEEIAGKQFTTLRHIEEMREKCRDNRKGQGCGSNRSAKRMEGSANGQHGLSVTERARLARAALEESARTLNVRSPNTSPSNISHQSSGTVTPLKRSS
jgi:hypothetical protein